MAERILVVGCNGLLGQKVVQELSANFGNKNILCVSIEPRVLFSTNVPYRQMDITKIDSVHGVIQQFKPTVVVNTAAYTNVDKAEIEKDLCWEINVTGVENLAGAAKEAGALLCHISTDYVFSGENGPYREEDKPDPRGFYAKSKWAAEVAIQKIGVSYLIARTSTLFGTGENVRPNFVLWLISALKENQEVTIVDDQIGNPTLADNLAEALRVAIEKRAAGVYHLTGREAVDRYSFAHRIAKIFGLNALLIKRGKTSHLKQLAPRPMNAAFIVEKAEKELGVHLMSVDEALFKLKQQLG